MYYDLCERCHQAPGTPAQADSLMRQRHAALREVASGSDVAKLDGLLRQRQPCKLCGTLPAPYKGIFQPEKPEIWGGTPEKVRLLIYGLCEQCFALPDKALRVEACFARDLTGRRN
jgi:hypothetical protein